MTPVTTGMSIRDVAGLEAVAGRMPPTMALKVIDHLDPGALRWIAQSPLMFAALVQGERVTALVAGGAAGFAQGDAGQLAIPLAALDDPAAARVGAGFGALFLLPGLRETLRVNGRVLSVADGMLLVGVEQCYGHCAKALIRSDFWSAAPLSGPQDIPGFVAASRFMALASADAQGHADLSPKGDPAGCMAQLEGGTLWFADRPGNRRLDSFRNIVEQPAIGLALMVPGAARVLTARGTAQLTTDADARARFAVRDKVPGLVVRIDDAELVLRDSPALARANPWPVGEAPDIDPTSLFLDHIRRNKTGGVGAALARATLAMPGMTGLMRKGLDKDYKDNLY